MPFPFPLPPWLPWWGLLVVAVPVLLYVLILLMMPFNVFGLRPRLEGIEARLDEIQGEIRSLSLRLPEPGRAEAARPERIEPAARRAPEPARPPIPPAPIASEQAYEQRGAYEKRELGRNESVRPEPIRPEPIRPEPIRPEPIRPEPGRSDAAERAPEERRRLGGDGPVRQRAPNQSPTRAEPRLDWPR